MDFSLYFPIWDKLTLDEQQYLMQNIIFRKVTRGTVIHDGNISCTGLLLVGSGQLRSYMLSEDGRELTLYRLFEHDMCLFSAACMMTSLQFEVIIEAEKDTELWIILPNAYKKLMESSVSVANYTCELMATRFSEIIWLLEQILWKSFDRRLAAFLLEESRLENSRVLKITHETIGNHMGNPREVVTRMLRYFQNEGSIKLSRGTIEILDYTKLKQLAE